MQDIHSQPPARSLGTSLTDTSVPFHADTCRRSCIECVECLCWMWHVLVHPASEGYHVKRALNRGQTSVYWWRNMLRGYLFIAQFYFSKQTLRCILQITTGQRKKAHILSNRGQTFAYWWRNMLWGYLFIAQFYFSKQTLRCILQITTGQRKKAHILSVRFSNLRYFQSRPPLIMNLWQWQTNKTTPAFSLDIRQWWHDLQSLLQTGRLHFGHQ